MPGKILVVDDLAANRELIREALDDCADQISEAPTASCALEHLNRHETDLVITDVRMPGMSGIELLERLRRDHPDVVVVVMSAFASVSDAVCAMKLGAHHFLSQPLDIDELRALTQQVLSNRPVRDSGEQRSGFEKILGRSKKLMAVLDQAARSATTDSTVLIQGETDGKRTAGPGHSFS